MASSRQRHRTKEGILDNISTLTKLGNKHLEIFLRWQGKVRCMSVRCIKSKPDTDTTGEYQAVVSGTLLRNVWLDRNLGATQKATSGTDSNAYGTYYKLGKATCPTNFTLPSEKDLKVLIAELGEGRYIVQNAFFSAMALPAAGHEKDDNI
jgi:hypothetical protein